MPQAERVETAKPEVRRFPLRQFSPEEAQEFLPGWTHRSAIDRLIRGRGEFGVPLMRRIHRGWDFYKTIDGEDYTLMIDTVGGRLKLEQPKALTDWVEVQGLSHFELNRRNGTLSFIGKNGSYFISDGGLSHYRVIKHAKGEDRFHLWLGKPKIQVKLHSQ